MYQARDALNPEQRREESRRNFAAADVAYRRAGNHAEAAVQQEAAANTHFEFLQTPIGDMRAMTTSIKTIEAAIALAQVLTVIRSTMQTHEDGAKVTVDAKRLDVLADITLALGVDPQQQQLQQEQQEQQQQQQLSSYGLEDMQMEAEVTAEEGLDIDADPSDDAVSHFLQAHLARLRDAPRRYTTNKPSTHAMARHTINKHPRTTSMATPTPRRTTGSEDDD